jgi:hypothetical protein
MPSSPAHKADESDAIPQPSRSHFAGPWPQRVAIWGTYIFGFFALLGTSPATLGLVALTLAFLSCFDHWKTLARDPLIQVCLVFALYVATHSLITYVQAPAQALADAAVDAGTDWIKLLLFVPVAYWLRGSRDRIGWGLLLSLLGFSIGFLRKIDWEGFDVTFF